jgi:hypothetical protein
MIKCKEKLEMLVIMYENAVEINSGKKIIIRGYKRGRGLYY